MKLKNILVGLEGLKANGDLEKEILGIDNKLEQLKNILLISVTLWVSHLEISGKDFKDEQL